MELTLEQRRGERRREIENAKKMTPSEKMELGGNLFDAECEARLDRIRRLNPGISNDAAIEALRVWLDIEERFEPLYIDVKELRQE